MQYHMPLNLVAAIAMMQQLLKKSHHV